MTVDINCFTRDYFILDAIAIRNIFIREILNNYIHINLIVHYSSISFLLLIKSNRTFQSG